MKKSSKIKLSGLVMAGALLSGIALFPNAGLHASAAVDYVYGYGLDTKLPNLNNYDPDSNPFGLSESEDAGSNPNSSFAVPKDIYGFSYSRTWKETVNDYPNKGDIFYGTVYYYKINENTLGTISPDTLMPSGQAYVYRLYNKHTGEHFYTLSRYEAQSIIKSGWNYEGVGWQAATTGKPVYRLYNPNAKGGDHYYTMSKYEGSQLVAKGWQWDNAGQPVFYSGGNTNLYVAYNPNAQSGAHNYTTSQFEQKSLLSGGWKFGAVAWKVEGAGGTNIRDPREPEPQIPNPEINDFSAGFIKAVKNVWNFDVSKMTDLQAVQLFVRFDFLVHGGITGNQASGPVTFTRETATKTDDITVGTNAIAKKGSDKAFPKIGTYLGKDSQGKDTWADGAGGTVGFYN